MTLWTLLWLIIDCSFEVIFFLYLLFLFFYKSYFALGKASIKSLMNNNCILIIFPTPEGSIKYPKPNSVSVGPENGFVLGYSRIPNPTGYPTGFRICMGNHENTKECFIFSKYLFPEKLLLYHLTKSSEVDPFRGVPGMSLPSKIFGGVPCHHLFHVSIWVKVHRKCLDWTKPSVYRSQSKLIRLFSVSWAM